MSSYYQVIARPQIHYKVRDSRELETLVRCVDLLRMGQLASLGDALAGRFLAVESASLTNSWADAQHLEVLPARHSGVAVLRAQRRTRQVQKAYGQQPWRQYPRSSTWTPAANPDQNPQAPRGQDKGKVKGKGKQKGAGGKPTVKASNGATSPLLVEDACPPCREAASDERHWQWAQFFDPRVLGPISW